MKRLKDALSSIPSASVNGADEWRWIWHLRLPPKIRIFMWRCLRGILSSKTNLQSRGVHNDPICLKCGIAEESMVHIFRDCNWSSFFWKISPLRLLPSSNSSEVNLQDWMLLIIKDKPPDFIEFFVSLLWSLWKARNLMEFQNKRLSHIECIHIAQSILLDFQVANQPIQPLEDSPTPLHWSFPPVGRIKFNSDASCDPSGNTGLGGAFRDHVGKLLCYVAKHVSVCDDIEVAEGLACLQGVRRARAEGYRDLIFEMDNQSLVLALQKGKVPRTPVGTIISDILTLSKDFVRVSFH